MITLKNLQIYLSAHCNLKCAECTHHSQFQSVENYAYDQFVLDMEQIKSMFKFEVAILIGGEPLLNCDIEKFAKYLKDNTLCDTIQINTNGIMVDRFDKELYQYIDRVVISKYPLSAGLTNKINTGINHLKQFENVKVDVLPLDWFLRTTRFKKSSDEITKNVWKNCTCGINSAYGYSGVVFNGKFYRCVLSFMKPKFLKKMNIAESEYQHMIGKDSVDLNLKMSDDEFETFYTNPSPLQACYWCAGCSGKKTDHRQMKDVNDLAPELLDKDLTFDYSYSEDRNQSMTDG